MKLQPVSEQIFKEKYCIGDIGELTIEEMFKRVAKTLASGEKDSRHWEEKFLWAMENGAIPAGRILSNAGAYEHKPETSTINCTVSSTIADSMDGILSVVKEAGVTLKAGCGIGYEFSTLRPKGAKVRGAGATTSGPLSFMEVYDKVCKTISSAGGRRGAQMATFDIRHPDTPDFISAKSKDGVFRNFNLSLLITDEFMRSVLEEKPHYFKFPMDSVEPNDIVSSIPAIELWDQIMRATYDYAEPGFILIDRVNRENNNWFCEDIRATNPCGEQPLPPNGSCLLGSVNITKFILNPFTPEASFNHDKYTEVVSVFTRMLDNVVEHHGLPLPAQAKEIETKRRHGMGFTGLGSALNMLGIRYGSTEAQEFVSEITKRMAITGWEESLSLAKEKSPAPIMNEKFKVTQEMINKKPALADNGIKVGDELRGKELLFRYSDYMARIYEQAPELIDELAEVGGRFTHHTSIAPTGTISFSVGNNISSGIEPSFAHEYTRNINVGADKAKKSEIVNSYEALLFKHLNPSQPLPESFVVADEVTPIEHVKMQAAAQKWVDSSISKTVNVPTDIPYEEFKGLYIEAYKHGLKGCTTFRFNPENFQGVLVRNEDLENTEYEFRTEVGTVKVKGSEMVKYKGEEMTAANLYDAVKEGVLQ